MRPTLLLLHAAAIYEFHVYAQQREIYAGDGYTPAPIVAKSIAPFTLAVSSRRIETLRTRRPNVLDDFHTMLDFGSPRMLSVGSMQRRLAFSAQRLSILLTVDERAIYVYDECCRDEARRCLQTLSRAYFRPGRVESALADNDCRELRFQQLNDLQRRRATFRRLDFISARSIWSHRPRRAAGKRRQIGAACRHFCRLATLRRAPILGLSIAR